MGQNVFLPSLIAQSGISGYLKKIYQVPILTENEEKELVYSWCELKDAAAAQKLVLAHLRLVVKMAMKFGHYGACLWDLISEGNIGLMNAVKKFQPKMGCRLATYAMWWIKAFIQDYIIKTWSLLKVNSAAVKKQLFYNLRKVKQKIAHYVGEIPEVRDFHELSAEHSFEEEEEEGNDGVMQLANVKLKSVKDDAMSNDEMDVMENQQMLRCSRNIASFSDTVAQDSATTLGDVIEDQNNISQENLLILNQDYNNNKALLKQALETLSTREKHILFARRLKEKATKLDTLSSIYKISAERVRQIEEKTVKKLQEYVRKHRLR